MLWPLLAFWCFVDAPFALPFVLIGESQRLAAVVLFSSVDFSNGFSSFSGNFLSETPVTMSCGCDWAPTKDSLGSIVSCSESSPWDASCLFVKRIIFSQNDVISLLELL